MKKILASSLTINLFLVGFCLWLLHRGRPVEKPSVSLAAAAELVPHENKTPPIQPQEMTSPAQTFRWIQLESTDYRTYIANLRGIGCPEQTLRDIIAADVDAAFYASQRNQLKQQQTAQSLEFELQKLNQQEASFIASLLGDQPAVAETAMNSPRVASILRVKSRAERDLDRAVFMPLVLQPVDAEAMKLTAAQAQTINELRQAFLQEIGGTNQDPNDPAYRQRWQAAQREADDMLTGLFGSKFTLNYQMQAEIQAARAN